jgi:hypothetical protein
MKKYIPLIAFGTLFCIGLLVKDDLLQKTAAGIRVSEKEEALYYIIQSLLWIPITTISGFWMFLFPKKVATWVKDVFRVKTVWSTIHFFNLRVIGFVLILFTIGNIKSKYDLYFDLFFK